MPDLIKEFHQGYLGGHLGAQKTYEALCRSYYSKNMWASTYKYVKNCKLCISTNTTQQKIPVQEIELPKFPFEKIACDLVGPYPTSHTGNRYVITLMCMLTGYIECAVSPDKSALSVAKFLVEEFIPRHSTPSYLLTDNGTEFVNSIMSYVTTELKIHHIKTSSYRPNSNGKLERSHSLLNNTLIKLSHKDPQSWDMYVKNYVGAYNASANSSGYSPFFLVYNRLPVYPIDTLLRPRDIYYGEDYGPQIVENMHRIFTTVRRNLKKESEKNRKRTNKNAVFDNIKVGSLVYLRNTQRKNKLDYKWYPTPFIVLRKTGPHSYRIQHPTTKKVYRYHGQNLRLSKANELLHRKRPEENGRKLRKKRRVMSSSSSSSSDSSSAEEEAKVHDQSDESSHETITNMHLPHRNDLNSSSSENEMEAQDTLPPNMTGPSLPVTMDVDSDDMNMPERTKRARSISSSDDSDNDMSKRTKTNALETLIAAMSKKQIRQLPLESVNELIQVMSK